MHYGKIVFADCANGLGIRVTLFVSGCTNHCKGCFQPETWDFGYGRPYTKETEDCIIKELSKTHYTGLTILGGEPFEPSNQEVIVNLIRRVKKEVPAKDIWVYTGFVYEKDLVRGGKKHRSATDQILDLIDILVDGPFIEEQKDISLRFRGSRNQRIIDMKATRRGEEIVLSKYNN